MYFTDSLKNIILSVGVNKYIIWRNFYGLLQSCPKIFCITHLHYIFITEIDTLCFCQPKGLFILKSEVKCLPVVISCPFHFFCFLKIFLKTNS